MPLWNHQQAAIDFALHRDATLITAKMGGGKSAIALELARQWDAGRSLVLCPSTVRSVWRREIAKHSTARAVILDRGDIARRTAEASRAILSPGSVFIVLNYEAAWREPFRSFSLGTAWDLVILDESHRVQKVGKTAEYAAALGLTARRRLCLTGTPLTQDPLSIWAQCRFLDPRIFGHDLDGFVEMYHNQHALPARKAIARLNEMIEASPAEWGLLPWLPPEECMRGTLRTKDYLHRVSRVACNVKVVLDLPPMLHEFRRFRLGRYARKIYRNLSEGTSLAVPSLRHGHLASVMRLQQITSGCLKDRQGRCRCIDQGRARTLRRILMTLNKEPVVVFARFKYDLDRIRRLACKMGLAYGEISHRRKDGLSEMGTMPDGLQVVGVQAQSGGAGIDLTRARYGIFYSLSWSLAEYDQAVARLHRPPQSRPVTIYSIVAENTVDEVIYSALAARRAIVKQAWGALNDPATTSSGGPSDTGGSQSRRPELRLKQRYAHQSDNIGCGRGGMRDITTVDQRRHGRLRAVVPSDQS
jgi:superfamily II DNA or RNA helicase